MDDECGHFRGWRAQSHSDTDLLRSLGYRVGQHRIQAHRRQEQRKNRESGRQLDDESLPDEISRKAC